VSFEKERCTLLLFEGSQDSAALNYALNARFGLEGVPFYLTIVGTGPESPIVPLTTALPTGMSLALHLRDGKPAFAPPSGLPRQPQAPGRLADHVDADVLRDRAEPLLADNSLVESSGNTFLVGAQGDEPPRRRSHSSVQMTMTSATRQERAAVTSFESAVENVDRMQRLTLDLANERTLLAWTRTSLAAMRTVFPFLGLTGEGLLWLGVLSSRCGMVVLCLFTGALGIVRYTQVKRVTFAPVHGPVHFGRVSIRWFTAFLAFACLVMVGCTAVVSVTDGN